jgi:CRP-like cAMP-binding protein
MRRVLYILGQLSDQDVDWLARTGERVNFVPGDIAIREGTRIDRIFFVVEGRFSVAIRDKEVARVGAGDILGEMSLVDEGLASASVTALSTARALVVSKDAVRARLEGDAHFAARFYKAIAIFLAERMRNTLLRLGYGDSIPEDIELRHDELGPQILDTVHLAGGRFERLLKILRG